MREFLAPVIGRLCRIRPTVAVLAAVMGATACSPTVRIVPPEEPIRIDLAVTIQQDVRVTVSQR